MEARKFLGIILLLFLLTISLDDVMEAEAAACSKPSKHFDGPCLFRGDCRFSCSEENYPDGKCSKPFGKCICYKPCDA